MTDYIYFDKEELLKKVNDVIKSALGEQVSFSADGLKSLIDSLPSVDAVEVIRCKDCKYRIMNYAENTIDPWITCRTIGFPNEIEVDDDFYCKWGEKE